MLSCVVALSLALAAGTDGARERTASLSPTEASQPRAGETIIVAFERSAKASARAKLLDLLGHDSADSLDLSRSGVRAELIELRDGEEAADAIARYERNPMVAYAEPNGSWQAHALPHDGIFHSLWGLHNTGQSVQGSAGTPDADIDAPEAWDLTVGSADVVVAIVDTGVHYEHPDLASNMWTNPGETGANRATNGVDDDGNGYVDDWQGWDWTTASELVPGSGSNDPLDIHGHGTHVAGVIGARGNDFYGSVGVNWDVSLMPLRVLDETGVGDVWAVAKAFAYASQKGAAVVNASFGGAFDSQAVSDSIANAPGTLFVTSAGNDGADNDAQPTYPCSYALANIVCVASSTKNDDLSDFSNVGATSVDLAAPGSEIRSSYLPFAFYDQLDTDANQWSFWIGGSNTWNWVPDGAGGGHLSDSPGGNYENNHDSWAEIRWLDLSESAGCALSYLVRHDLAAGDYLQLEYRVASGEPWVPRAAPLQGSSDGEWTLVWEELTGLDGAIDIGLRFHLHTDAAWVADGVELDDVAVSCLFSPPEHFTWLFGDSTSLAAAHVAGAAANLKARRPLASAGQLKDALLDGVEEKPAFAGTSVSEGRLNLRQSHLALPNTVPHPPRNTTATAGNAQATVGWAPPPSDGGSPVVAYTVTPYAGGVPQAPHDVGNVTQAVIGGLANGTTYTFRVSARNAVGDGPQSEPSGAVMPATVPTAPGNVVAEADDAEAIVRWTAPSSDGGRPLTKYVVTPLAGQTALPSIETTSTLVLAVGLTNGTAHTFRVTAWNAIGESPAAVSGVVTPRAFVAPPAVVVARAAKVSPAKPKAGRAVVVTVRVTRGAAPVKPTRVACAASIGKAKAKGAAGAARGSAKCTYKTKRTAKGKTLKGFVSFTAGGKRFTKRFSVKLR